MWWNHDYGWVGWLAMTIGMAGFWIAVARHARGEIDVEDYRERLEAMSRQH